MTGIIVALPNRDNAANIRNLLVKNGLEVAGVCTSGASVLHSAGTLDDGLVICGYRLQDMMYSELREYLDPAIQLLLVASPDKWSDGEAAGVVGLSLPLKAYDLINTVHMMLQAQEAKRRQKKQRRGRSPAEQRLIDEAKALLMERNNMTEGEAHKYLQKSSMDSGTGLVETAQMVLSLMSE